MTTHFSFSKLAGTALLGSVITGSLLGCQPAADTDAAASEASADDHAEHDHAEHDHAEHDHAEHDHAEHDHAEHDHAEHDHAEHDHAEHDHAEHDHAEHDHAGHDHAGHHHGSSGTPFSCEPDNTTIAVHYHNDSNPQEAHLLIDGLEYDVTATSDSEDSSEQKTYVSDIGLDDTHGIIWQVNGDNATLFSKTLDSNVAIEDEDILFNCQPS